MNINNNIKKNGSGPPRYPIMLKKNGSGPPRYPSMTEEEINEMVRKQKPWKNQLIKQWRKQFINK